MGAAIKMIRFLILIIIFPCLVIACDNLDLWNDKFDEELAVDIFVGSNNERIVNQIVSIRIYKIETNRFHSETWLAANSISFFEVKEIATIKNYITQLSYKNRVALKSFTEPKPFEYHVIVEILSGDKAYLRLLEERSNSNFFRARPLASVVYQIKLNREEILLQPLPL